MAPARYYDANKPAGVAIDGVADSSVPATPVSRWKQVSGARGSVVMVVDLALGSGTLENYYLDNSDLNGDDTGDGRSYGDAGLKANNPGGLVTVDSRIFVLDPQAPNVGSTYEDYLDNPLQATAVAQTYTPLPPYQVYLPLVVK